MRCLIINALLAIVFLFSLHCNLLYANNSLEALKQLQEVNKALKRTIERMKEEGTLNQGDKKQIEERYQKIFQEELKKAKEESFSISTGIQDPFLEKGLQVCENMKKNKEELSASAGKKILVGAAAGAVIGSAAAGKDRRREGAIIGAIGGALAATAYELWNKRHFFEESPEKVAKRVNYSPEKGAYIKISKLEFDKTNYRDNENAKLIMRIELLTPDFNPKVSEEKNLLKDIFSFKKGDAEYDNNNTTTQRFYDIKVEAYLVKENREIFIAEEKYSMPMGSYPFLYVFPMCPIIPKGTYELKFKVSYGEMQDEKRVSFEKI